MYMVHNTDENRTEAVSVMDLKQMEETGNVHVADMEVRLVLPVRGCFNPHNDIHMCS